MNSVFDFFSNGLCFFFQRFAFQMVLTQQMVLKVFFTMFYVFLLKKKTPDAFLQKKCREIFSCFKKWFLQVKSVLLQCFSSFFFEDTHQVKELFFKKNFLFHERKRFTQKVFKKRGFAQCCCVTGREYRIGDALRIQSQRVDVSRSY